LNLCEYKTKKIMASLVTLNSSENTPVSQQANKKGIENHKTAAKHHEEAAKHHHEAAKHHDEGHHDKAAQSTVKANGHHTLAGEAQKEDVKHHALHQ
jgi:hypothetical protein